MGFPSHHFKRHGRGTKRKPPGAMNKTEAKYAAHLDVLQRAGQIEWWKFEAVTLKLAPDLRLTVDFVVMMPDGTIEFRDTKGSKRKKVGGASTGEWTYYAEEDAIVKMKTAAEMFPFRFSLVWPEPAGWGRKDFWEKE